MPPWHASPEYGKFGNDAHLTDEREATDHRLGRRRGARGRSRELPELPTFAEGGWRIPKPDLIIELPKTVDVPAKASCPISIS